MFVPFGLIRDPGPYLVPLTHVIQLVLHRVSCLLGVPGSFVNGPVICQCEGLAGPIVFRSGSMAFRKQRREQAHCQVWQAHCQVWQAHCQVWQAHCEAMVSRAPGSKLYKIYIYIYIYICTDLSRIIARLTIISCAGPSTASTGPVVCVHEIDCHSQCFFFPLETFIHIIIMQT